MDPAKKFKLRAFLYYLCVEPWTKKISLPNTRTMVWVLIFMTFFFKLKGLFFLFLLIGLFLHLRHEYKSGKFIHWYKQRKYKVQREALKKAKEGN